MGPARGLGLGMKAGLEKSLEGKRVQGRSYKLLFRNDSYEPDESVRSTQRIIKRGIFAFLGNVGTPTAEATLPILTNEGIPAVGFFTGAGLLRTEATPTVNFRASYLQETERLITEAMKAGVKTNEFCAYVQNDAFGMAGLSGFASALKKGNADPKTLALIDEIINKPGVNPDRNNIGPVGVYVRNSIRWKSGFDSIVRWEDKTKTRCRVVVTVGAYSNIALFIRGVRKKARDFVVSAVSFTGADRLHKRLKKYRSIDKVVMTQVVPLLDSNLPIVKEARAKLGRDFGYVSLEGYIVGSMFHRILGNVDGPISRESFLAQVKKSKFDLGGVAIDFTKNGNQGSDLVIPSLLTTRGWQEFDSSTWTQLLKAD